ALTFFLYPVLSLTGSLFFDCCRSHPKNCQTITYSQNTPGNHSGTATAERSWRISRNTAVAKAPLSREKASCRCRAESASSHCQLISCGFSCRGRRSCCKPTCSSPLHHSVQSFSASSSTLRVSSVLARRPRPQSGPLGCFSGSPVNSIDQLLSRTRAAVTRLNR